MAHGQFEKGHKGFKKKGTKHKATLLKEERRAIFDDEITQVFIEKIHKAKPEYILDQYLGKAPDELIVRAPVLIDQDIAEKNEITHTSKDDSEGQAQIQSIKVRKKIRENNTD